MLEMGTSGLMSGDGKRGGGFNVSTRVRPRLYNGSRPIVACSLPDMSGRKRTHFKHTRSESDILWSFPAKGLRFALDWKQSCGARDQSVIASLGWE
jgi:hypothetical protein